MNESVVLMQACMERYQNSMDRLAANLRPGDGILGFGNDPKRSPYHMDFYNELGELAGRLAGGEWPADQAEEAVEFLLTMAEKFGKRLTAPMMEAAQGHALPLVPLLPCDRAEQLARSYDRSYPRRMRTPVQEKVFRALEKQARGR
ncbi:hypothetical protein DWX58_13760 [Pseudoflavonifractor sp. AF19-9AC]|uniref:hypothetical protein n=1 Tax=Pseudoflavonifractor sp. AF19-9AC TaxID=2292244 RepID=UPI000E47BCF8|nr:hypothetical protein [Pseudoflavonifractor sp. AF19-9AC]RHR05600.1 hypothetical protein DWX58_13760 [Pseudoflavonifractor sp. AF19-9AC]